MPAARGFFFLEPLLAARTGLPNASKREMPVARKSTAEKPLAAEHSTARFAANRLKDRPPYVGDAGLP